MCGLAGVFSPRGSDPDRDRIVRRMTAQLAHRGPDGEGYRFRERCALGFRRLAIVDPEASTIPPFGSEDGRIWTVCNGEIYNADVLRASLEKRGHRFLTDVDTEVLPHLYEEHGVALVDHLDGMFAFAIWDEGEGRLVLGRDRAGEKPLFFACCGPDVVFASELGAMLAHPRVPRELDPVALRRYLTHDFFPAPHTPFAGVHKLPAGHTAVISEHGIDVRPYWDLADYYTPRAPQERPRAIAEALDARISSAVARRRRADVPVGVFLSGGLDSSTILAHMTEQVGPGVPAFSLGHEAEAFDEARFAERTARHFKADYHALIVGRDDLEEGLRLIAHGFDEPLGDASTIPTHLLSRFARQRVKVVLSGEGGDELFAGYPTYLGDRVADAFGRIPATAQRALARVARAFAPVSMGNVGLDYLIERFLSGATKDLIERHHTWFGSIAPERHAAVFAPHLRGALEADDAFAAARARLAGRSLPDAIAALLYTDFTMYLQDGLLTKVDRATMLASLESRAPFLDHELAGFVAGLPSDLKLRGRTGKWILREAVRHRLPREILTRRKRGFNIPFSLWLLDGLGERLRARFSEERVEARGLFAYAGVMRFVDEHLRREADHRKPLFTLLAFDLWCDRTYGDGAPVPIAVDSKSTYSWPESTPVSLGTSAAMAGRSASSS